MRKEGPIVRILDHNDRREYDTKEKDVEEAYPGKERPGMPTSKRLILSESMEPLRAPFIISAPLRSAVNAKL